MRLASLACLALSLALLASAPAGASGERLTLNVRDHVVDVTASETGLLYTVKTEDGAILDRDLVEEQLEAKYPELAALLQAGEVVVPGAGAAVVPLAITTFTAAE